MFSVYGNVFCLSIILNNLLDGEYIIVQKHFKHVHNL